MTFERQIRLKNGQTAILRNGTAADGAAALENFLQARRETDYLLSYPDESTLTVEDEGRYLQEKTDSPSEIELLALVDGKVAGMVGIEAVGTQEKVRHRADFGVSILREYWGLGLGKAMMEACIQCAREAGYAQLELTVVAENERAIALYQKHGFVECGHNPRGFRSRFSGYQEIVTMRLEL